MFVRNFGHLLNFFYQLYYWNSFEHEKRPRVQTFATITGKPIKRGMKVWMRCDSTSGYCHQFNIYMGKDDPNKGTELGQKVVKLLCKDLKWKGHHVYMDRYIMFFC